MVIRRGAVLAAAAGLLALSACGKTPSVAPKASPTPTPPASGAGANPTATATNLPTVAVAPASTPTPTLKGIPTVTGPATPPASLPAGGTTFTDGNNGQVVHVSVGEQFRVSLGSTYWTFEALPGATVLRSAGTPVTAPSPGCIPGGGCGTVTALFVAAGPGQATVRAGRRSCGEAMLCTGAAGQFSLTVIVP